MPFVEFVAALFDSYGGCALNASDLFQARVLATIGVTRGLGDHSLKVHDSNIYIKPFLSCCPEVRSSFTFLCPSLCLPWSCCSNFCLTAKKEKGFRVFSVRPVQWVWASRQVLTRTGSTTL